jgi:hypothetical protein
MKLRLKVPKIIKGMEIQRGFNDAIHIQIIDMKFFIM